MPDTKFLFINKSANSSHLTRGEAAETAAIQHFVQKGRSRARNPKLLISAFSVTQLQSQRTLNKHRDAKNTSAAKRCDCESSKRCSFVGCTNCKRLPESKDKNLLLSFPLSSSVDPFQVTSIPIDRGVQDLIHYYTKVYHPTVWPNETLALRQGGCVFETAVNQVVQISLRDDLMMYCLMAASLCRLRNIDRLPVTFPKGKENEYMAKALRRMQSRVDQEAMRPSENVIELLNSMLFLSAAEAYRGDTVGSRLHLEGCVNLLAYHNMTVSDVENTNLQGQLYMSDLFIGCVELQHCLFNSNIYDPGPAETLGLREDEIHKLPPELVGVAESLLIHDLASSDIRKAVIDIKETYTMRRCLKTSSMSTTRALETSHWITKRNMAIRNRLLLPFSRASEISSVTDKDLRELLDKAIRIALIQFTLISMSITGRIKTAKVMSGHLRKYLAPLIASQPTLSEQSQRALWLWLILMGFSCAEDGSDIEEWFAKIFQDHVKVNRLAGPWHKSAKSWDDNLEAQQIATLELAQRQFFYHEEVQRSRLTKLIHSIQSPTP